MSSRTPGLLAAAAVVVLAVAVARLAVGSSSAPVPPDPPAGGAPPDDAVAQARAFLDAYLLPTGQVVRADQGGDTVSEGQAWALLVAVALEDQERAEAVVTWTEDHLARDDGTLAWRWANGEVADPQPASDADLVYAWALDLGATTFGRPTWEVRATELLDALGRSSTVDVPGGTLLTAGPWATGGDDGAVVNPSYLWPAALRWAATRAPSLAGTPAGTQALLDRLLHDDTPLVPDWVRVDRDGTVTSIGAPGSPGQQPQHGLDAVRTWIWLASDCDPEVRALAATAAGQFVDDPDELAAVHGLAGDPLVEWRHPATLAGAAAVADAAGDEALARRRLEAAAELQAEHPTYYGSAVTALARLLLDTDRIVACDVTG